MAKLLGIVWIISNLALVWIITLLPWSIIGSLFVLLSCVSLVRPFFRFSRDLQSLLLPPSAAAVEQEVEEIRPTDDRASSADRHGPAAAHVAARGFKAD